MTRVAEYLGQSAVNQTARGSILRISIPCNVLEAKLTDTAAVRGTGLN